MALIRINVPKKIWVGFFFLLGGKVQKGFTYFSGEKEGLKERKRCNGDCSITNSFSIGCEHVIPICDKGK